MKVRVAKKILKRWSRCFPASMSPRDAWRAGFLPWTWRTWAEAHRVILECKPKRAIAKTGM